MKFNFRKISAIATSLLLTGMTAGIAAAANYPAPFVSGSTADVAIVYGTGAGVSALDQVQAQNIETNLASKVTGGVGTASGGDAVLIEKASTKLELGRGLLQVRSTSLDKNDMPILLANGIFTDANNDEFDYKQSIALANLTLTQFDNDDYKVDTPTLGVEITDGTYVMNYTLDLTEEPYWNDLETATLPIMGKEYYVLDVAAAASNNSITLLDSAADAIVAEGDSATIAAGGKSYQVSINFVGESTVKLNVDGKTTNSLAEGQTQRLADGSYVGIKDILYTAKDTGISKVELSIGAGKLVLTDNDEVQMNDEDIDNLKAYIRGDASTPATSSKLSSVTLEWSADRDLFVAPGSEAVMPGFGAVKMSFGGMVFPTEETILLQADGDDNFVLKDFPLKDTTQTIYLFKSDGTNFTLAGKDDNNQLAILNVNGTTLNFTEGTDDYFVLSYMSGDDAESYLVRAKNFDDSTYPDNEVDFEYLSGSTWTSLDTNVVQGDTVSIGSAEFSVGSISNETTKTVEINNETSTSFFDRIFSARGLEVMLPKMANFTSIDYITPVENAANDTLAEVCAAITTPITFAEGVLMSKIYVSYNATGTTDDATGTASACYTYQPTYILRFKEEDKDDAIGLGGTINVTLGLDTDSEVKISSYTKINKNENTVTASEIGDTEVYQDYVSSALATKILDDQSGDHEKMTLVYHGGESYGQVYVTDVSAVVSGSGSLGNVLVKDSEVSSVATKNLVIVGGSCINSAAASVLGGAFCGAAFTEATGVGTGEFLIKGVSDADITSKLALVVAGYEAADTVAATTYLTTQTVDTSKTYKGTSSTSAEVVVA